MRWFLSMHAIQRMRQMGLDRQTVVKVIDEAECSWTNAETGRTVWTRGHLAAVTVNGVVLTVLYHHPSWWERPIEILGEILASDVPT